MNDCKLISLHQHQLKYAIVKKINDHSYEINGYSWNKNEEIETKLFYIYCSTNHCQLNFK